jgi:hypothetical protein
MNKLEEELKLVSSRASLDNHLKRGQDGPYQVASLGLKNQTLCQFLQNRYKGTRPAKKDLCTKTQ